MNCRERSPGRDLERSPTHDSSAPTLALASPTPNRTSSKRAPSRIDGGPTRWLSAAFRDAGVARNDSASIEVSSTDAAVRKVVVGAADPASLPQGEHTDAGCRVRLVPKRSGRTVAPGEEVPMSEFELEPTGNEDAAFKVWVSGPAQNPTHLGRRGARLKLGKKVCKTAVFSQYGDQDTGEVKSRELRLSAYERHPDGTFAFDSPNVSWYIVDEEIEQLLAFLKSEVDQPGRYRVIDTGSPAGTLLEILDGRPDSDSHQVLTALSGGADPKLLADALAQSASGLTGAEMAVIGGRRALLQQAADLAADPATTETDMQHLIGSAWWVFGGRYVGVLKRRDLLTLDEHDIPLISADGSLHIVELKGPNIPAVVKKHRNHWIVGNDVHEATMQAANYLRTADEEALALQTLVAEELGIDIRLRRAFATVVVGHKDHLRANDIPDGQLELAIRTYNAQLSRVQVVTYDQLIDTALRSLSFDVV
jgi:hypothetical protein